MALIIIGWQLQISFAGVNDNEWCLDINEVISRGKKNVLFFFLYFLSFVTKKKVFNASLSRSVDILTKECHKEFLSRSIYPLASRN